MYDQREWLETDGLGGFASGPVWGPRTRRSHALLLVAAPPPTEAGTPPVAGSPTGVPHTASVRPPMVLVNGLDARVRTAEAAAPIATQRYAPDVIAPEGLARLAQFLPEPWPQWTIQLADGTRVLQELFVVRGSPLTVLSWRLASRRARAKLEVRPFLSGRDDRALHRENPVARLQAAIDGERITWRPYDGVPAVTAASNGTYTHLPDWYRRFLYTGEQALGAECTEDLMAPGVFRWDLAQGEALLCFSAAGDDALPEAVSTQELVDGWRRAERRRRQRLTAPAHRAADAYLIARGPRRTIVDGYPWSTDQSRDAIIALRGLCLATGRLAEARRILLGWAGREAQEPASVDAALWYVIAVDAYVKAAEAEGRRVSRTDQAVFRAAIDAALSGCADGARRGVHADEDGLLVVDGRPAAPRTGKPVDLQALWLNALWIGSPVAERWEPWFAKGREAFLARFWNAEGGGLYDAVDVDRMPGRVDASCRPNQIFAVGGLPIALVTGERARRIVETVESRLLTPAGLRSLAPGGPGDGVGGRHTVRPWLLGPFVEAWLRVYGTSPETLQEARRRFLGPLTQQLDTAGIGHLPEMMDAEPPHAPRGRLFYAASLAECLRAEQLVASLQDLAAASAVAASV